MTRAGSTVTMGSSAWIVTSIVGVFLTLLLGLPLIAIFMEAFSEGWGAFFAAFAGDHTIAALKLTLEVVLWTLPIVTIFGLAAAWLLSQFRFPGRALIVALIDLPLTVSTVVYGLMLVLLFGRNGTLSGVVAFFGFEVMYATPAIVLATVFVTLPIVAREMMPTMQERGSSEELAAMTLGASPTRTLVFVTLPALKRALTTATLLALCRAVGEYGAVSVVSGKVRGRTNTASLQVDALYNDYDLQAAFALSALLVCVALIPLVFKVIQAGRRRAQGRLAPLSQGESQ